MAGNQRFVYVTGGGQRASAYNDPEWRQFERAIIARVDLESGAVERLVEYVSPRDACPDWQPSIVFKSGSLRDGHLYACTQTEVLAYSLSDLRLSRYVSLPVFNDVHHVLPLADGGLLVASTGLDAVVEVLPNDDQGRIWDLDGHLWERFSRDTDYRKVPTTKPHRVHPNFLFERPDGIWVTRFEQRDAVNIEDFTQRIAIDIERPHDGIAHGDRRYFTTVDGHVVVTETAARKAREVLDLNDLDGRGVPLGWCRGILPFDDCMWVGFSRIRATAVRRNVSWVRHGFRAVGGHRLRATRLACFSRGQLEAEIDLESHGINVVFSILPASTSD